jgi:hypothetical protein
MYITPASFWYLARAFWLRFKNLQLVAEIGWSTGEDGGFHHHPHVVEPRPLDEAHTF